MKSASLNPFYTKIQPQFQRRLSVAMLLLILLSVVPTAPAEARKGKTVTIEHIMEQIEKARRRSKPAVEADLLYSLARRYFDQRKFGRAERALRKSLKIEDTLDRSLDDGSGTVYRVHNRTELAKILLAQGKLQQTVDTYNEAAAIAAEKGLDTTVATISVLTGKIYLRLNKLDEARAAFQKTRAIAQQKADKGLEVAALSSLADIARIHRKYENALKLLNEAKQKAGLELDAIEYGRLLFELGRTYADMGIYDKAEAQYREAMKELESDPLQLGQLMTALGNLQLIDRRVDDALATLNKAYEILSRENNASALLRAMNALGSAETEASNYDKALSYHRRAEKLASRVRHRIWQLEAITEQGYDYFLRGDVEKGLKMFLKAHKFVARHGPFLKRTEADVNRDCGMAFRAVGQSRAAIKFYEKAAKLYAAARRPVNQAVALDSIAVAYLDNGNTERFQEYHKKAQSVFEGAEETSGTSDGARLDVTTLRVKANLSYNYGQYCLYKDRFADAIPMYEKALGLYEKAGDTLGQCHALRGLGLTYLDLAQAGKSKRYYEQAAHLADKIGNIETQWDCATGLGKALMKLGEKQAAEKELLKAVELADRERRQLSRDSFKTSSLSLREQCFFDLVELLISDGRYDQALEIAEKGRARAFLDLLEGRKHSAETRNKVATISHDLLEDMQEKQQGVIKIAMALPSTPGFRSVNVIPKSARLVEASALSPVNAKAPTLAELKDLVKDSGAYVVEFVTMRDKIVAWVIAPNGEVLATRQTKVNLKEVKDLIQKTYGSITTSAKGLDHKQELEASRQENLRKLYSILISPIEKDLPKDPSQLVTIVPYGPLFLVPFAALISEQGKFLVEDHTLNYLPAIAVLRATRNIEKATESETNSLLAFGNPIIKTNEFLGKLPFSASEVKKVASLFDQTAVNIKIGEAATKSEFRKLAPSYSYIHLATHGLINPERPMDSAVVLAPEKNDDGLLTVKDILGLPPLQAKMIVLSACQTGKGKVTGDGVIGLSRAFVIAGTPSVMVSQWNVDDVMTEYQMGLFYKALLTGGDKAASLREAQLKTIAFMEKGLSSSADDQDEADGTTRVRANPRYWAAFQLIGEHKK